MGNLNGHMSNLCEQITVNVTYGDDNHTGSLHDVYLDLFNSQKSRNQGLTEMQKAFDGTHLASQVISTTGCVLLYILLVLECLVARHVEWIRTLLKSREHFVFMLTGLLFSIMNIFSVTNFYLEWVSRFIIFGSAAGPFLVYGLVKFFKQSGEVPVMDQLSEQYDPESKTDDSESSIWLPQPISTDENEQLISSRCEENTEADKPRLSITEPERTSGVAARFASYGDTNLERVMGFVTFLLVAMEIFLIFALVKKSVSQNHTLESVGRILLVFQKVIQAVVYAYMCKRVVRPKFKLEAILYLKIFALSNLTFWIDSLVNIENSLMFTLATLVYGPAFKIAETIYEALLTDYRLLFAFALLEHAYHLENDCNFDQEDEIIDIPFGKAVVPVFYRSLQDEQARYIGYFIGFVLMGTQVIWTLQYVPKLELSPAVHGLALVVHISIIVLAIQFMKANSNLRHAEASGLDTMAAYMGAVGVCYWLFKSFLVFYWTATWEGNNRHYFVWTAAKYLTRGVCAVFQIILLLKINEKAIIKSASVKRRNHIMAPALMVGMLVIFIGSAVDQYLVKKVDLSLKCGIRSWSLKLLMLGGPPIYLGFCIHLFIKFLIISRNMGKTWAIVDKPREDSLQELLLEK